MIQISLHDKVGDLLRVDTHPQFIDFPWRDSRAHLNDARVELALENIATAVLATIDSKSAIETYPDFTRARGDILDLYPHREDGIRVLEMLIAWSRRFPEARWNVTGAETIVGGELLPIATQPRFSEYSLTIDPFANGVAFLQAHEPMDDVEGIGLAALANLEQDISGAALLQRDIRIIPKGGSKNKGRKKSTTGGQINMGDQPPSKAAEPPSRRGEVMTTRIKRDVKTALETSGVKRELIEMLGAALMQGKTIDEIRAALTAA